MFTILSVITAVKDYVEIVHKLIESDSTNQLTNYFDVGAISTYVILGGKQLFSDIISFNWLRNVGSLPTLVPEVASAMISEISVLDGYFHNAFTVLENPISYGDNNLVLFCLEKFTIGMINSVFLCLPTSTAHIITLRRFVMQGLEAGYIAGLGTIAGNVLWIGSVVLGLRFVVIPWLSFDIFRYLLGFILLVKYMWDSYSERRTVLEDLSKQKIFLLNFLLAFTEQTSIYPFISNLSIGSDATILESFPAENVFQFVSIHGFYLLGIIVGSLSLLQFTCWFWENPAFNMYMWMISSFKVTTGLYYKFLNFFFLYLTMIGAISSVAYFGLDYTITNPLGFVHEDRLVDQKILNETSFLNTKASDRNTRRNRGRHGRRERWKRRVRRYRTFDASLYDQGVYDLFTMEDLNYGFDRFWLRRKIRNHRVRFRFFPGPWMRSFKKQLARPRLESFMGPRVEFFRILFEQVYHPEFHEFNKKQKEANSNKPEKTTNLANALAKENNLSLISLYNDRTPKEQKENLRKEFSALRKFVRKFNTRIKTSKILYETKNGSLAENDLLDSVKPIHSKKWKQIFSKMSHQRNTKQDETLLRGVYHQVLQKDSKNNKFLLNNEKKNDTEEKLSKQERQILRYKTFLTEKDDSFSNSNLPFEKGKPKQSLSGNNVSERVLEFPLQTSFATEAEKSKRAIDLNSKKPTELETLSSATTLNSQNATPYFVQKESKLVPNAKNSKKVVDSSTSVYKSLTLLHPIKFYLQKEQSFQRKLKFYGANVFRSFGVENNAPYFRTMMKRFFYYYKPTLRWERTMRTATMRKVRRKGSRIPRHLNRSKKMQGLSQLELQSKDAFSGELGQVQDNKSQIQKPTHFYSLVSKRASRYRYQIYKDVLQHWYYSPFNRFLLKFDVDSFIRRQPASHFLTKNEENLLNLRRFLLHEHYETLRWYTFMQHYSSMKSHIGGTKSFASRLYSQQFQGTFKKVRHLFAMTPSSTENTLLRFDQPLYNEFSNNANQSMIEDSLLHEELLADDDVLTNSKFMQQNDSGIKANSSLALLSGDDLTRQSTKVIREYLWKSAPIRQNLITKFIEDKNYWELTQFLYKGEKTRGSAATTNEKSFLIQEKNALLTTSEKQQFQQIERQKLANFFSEKMEQNFSVNSFQQDLWFQFIQKCHNQLYNQESLKLYLSRHVEKRQRQKQRQEKYLKLRLERMKNWLLIGKQKASLDKEQSQISGLTTAIQKSLKEGIYYQKNWPSGFSTERTLVPLVKSNIRNNRMVVQWPQLLSTNQKNDLNKSMNLKEHLKNRVKLHKFQTIQIEKDFQNQLLSVNQENSASQNPTIISRVNSPKVLFLFKKTLTPFTVLSKWTYNRNIMNAFSWMKNAWMQTPEKDLRAWRQQENILTKRKKMRKGLKRLRNTNARSGNIWKTDDLLSLNDQKFSSNNVLRKKRDSNPSFSNLRKQRSVQSWKQWRKQSTEVSSDASKNQPWKIVELWNKLTSKSFKRKRSRLRRYRRLKGRGPIKKRTLGEKLKRQFRLLKKYGRMSDTQTSNNQANKKLEILQMITLRKYEPQSEFSMRQTKQRRTRQRKHRFWKKHKKQKYAQNKRKQRKRRRYAIGKIRVLNKELKRVKASLTVKKWWWETFLPNMKAKQEVVWQNELNQQFKEKLDKLSIADILERDQKAVSNYVEKVQGEKTLQIGNRDFKPLATPEALLIREQLRSQNPATFDGKIGNGNKVGISFSKETKGETQFHQEMFNSDQKIDPIGQISKNVLVQPISNRSNVEKDSSPFLVGINPFPFYAGWDESLRKFVVTNRYLSKKEAGYLLKFAHLQSENTLNSKVDSKMFSSNLQPLFNKFHSENVKFSEAPLKGMNAATTLYWQVPFTTYDPDQFFALGMDGFSPIGWKKFHFRHSTQTTKPLLVQTKTLHSNMVGKSGSNLEFVIETKINENHSKIANLLKSQSKNHHDRRQNKKNQYRKIQKRYKRVKKHPRPPVWFPSGPLTNQVLPVHYIYVFYKRYRLPRDRYIRRRLRRNKDGAPLSIGQSIQNQTDFTLRRRALPKRKYHRKTNLRKNSDLFLKRRKFREMFSVSNGNFVSERSRPISKNQLSYLKNADQLEKRTFKNSSKERRKGSQKQQSENLRVRQLRRRIQRQVIRPTWRYKPRAGGFTWPGDYLRLELVRAPKFNLPEQNLSSTALGQLEKTKTTSQRKIRKKKRRSIQEWQVQPKKYLLEKHNIQVLKNRLQKSQNANKLQKRVKEFQYFFLNKKY